CRNKSGHIYLAVWLDETEDQDVWLYVSLSPQRFMKVRGGEIDLHDAFAKPEDKIVLEVSVYKDSGKNAKVKPVLVEKVDEDWFPLPGDYLDVPNSLPQVLWENLDQRDKSFPYEPPKQTIEPIETET
ncbi:MAG: hypothetical protein GWN00_39255, partial [Aliifodinibius sp.]|nr:hypothetical protein [Fodinibius sp.]NIY30601.1 hypothetical protein [Fodinibius sp.]